MSAPNAKDGIESFMAEAIREAKSRRTPLSWIVLEAQWQAAQLGELLAPDLLPALLRRDREEERPTLEEEIRAFAWDYLHDRRRYKKRFGDSAQERTTRREVQRNHDLVVAVRREFEACEETTFDTASDRDDALVSALRRAGIPEGSLRDAAALVPVIRQKGLFAFYKKGRSLSSAVAALSNVLDYQAETIRDHYRAWPKLKRLIQRANSPDNRRLFIRERRKAFAACSAGKARLEYLGARRRARALAKRRGKYRGRVKAARSLRKMPPA